MSYVPFAPTSILNTSATALASTYQNAYGSTINVAIPVSINTSSQITPVDVTSETSVFAMVGITNASIPNGANGIVIDNGRVQNVSTSFSVGDPLYAGIGGTVINVKPSIGSYGFVAGNWVIFLGVVVKNQFNPSQYDYKLMIERIGQL